MERFRMRRIQVKQFAILGKEMPKNGIELNTSLSYQYSNDAKAIACSVCFEFKSSEDVILLLDVQCEYDIHPEDWDKLFKGDKFEITRSLQEILAVHTIGTSRGILFCKTEGTPFNSLIIPPINVTKMLGDDSSDVS